MSEMHLGQRQAKEKSVITCRSALRLIAMLMGFDSLNLNLHIQKIKASQKRTDTKRITFPVLLITASALTYFHGFSISYSFFLLSSPFAPARSYQDDLALRVEKGKRRKNSSNSILCNSKRNDHLFL